jgi:hypothetical protein
MPSNDGDDPVAIYRKERARILSVLHDCIGTFGDDLSTPRVKAFIADPVGAPITELGYVSGLKLYRFYVSRDKPNKSDRAVLWNALMVEFEKPGTNDPGGWSPDTNTAQLHGIVDEAIGEE